MTEYDVIINLESIVMRVDAESEENAEEIALKRYNNLTPNEIFEMMKCRGYIGEIEKVE